MTEITREHLCAFVDDALTDSETARIEQMLRDSESLRLRLRDVLMERDRGEHSLGAVWRRERLTCPTREQIGSYLLEVLEPDLMTYIEFHLNMIGCAGCLANLADLQEHAAEAPPTTAKRRKRYYQSSAGLLNK